MQARAARGSQQANQEPGLVPARRPARVYDGHTRGGIVDHLGIGEAESPKRFTNEPEGALRVQLGWLTGNKAGEIGHVLTPLTGSRVVADTLAGDIPACAQNRAHKAP
jgi:hypothetical protein